MPGRKRLMRACGRLDTAKENVNSKVLALLVLFVYAGHGVAERGVRTPLHETSYEPILNYNYNYTMTIITTTTTTTTTDDDDHPQPTSVDAIRLKLPRQRGSLDSTGTEEYAGTHPRLRGICWLPRWK